jgi:hypothetical protein
MYTLDENVMACYGLYISVQQPECCSDQQPECCSVIYQCNKLLLRQIQHWNHTTFRFWNAPFGYLPQIATKLINSRNQISETPQLDISGAL